MKRKVHGAALAACAAAVLALAGCGGGGGGDAPAETKPSTTPNTSPNKPPADIAPKGIEGIWTNTTKKDKTVGYATQMVILNDGSLWGSYGTRDSDTYTIGGMLHGRAYSQAGNQVSATYQQYDITDPANNIQTSLSGSLVDRSILDLTLSNGAAVQLGYDSRYEQAVSIDSFSSRSIRGMHMGKAALSGPAGLGRANIIIDIADTNLTSSRVSASGDLGGCTIKGTLTPRGNVGVFNTSLTFSGANCMAGDGTTFSGIIYYLDDRRNFDIMTVTPDGKTAFYFMSFN